jgi:hypothetical protein
MTSFSLVIYLIMTSIVLMMCQIRRAPSEFNESRLIIAASYQLTLVSVIVTLIAAFVTNVIIVAVSQLVGIILAVTCTIFLIDYLL